LGASDDDLQHWFDTGEIVELLSGIEVRNEDLNLIEKILHHATVELGKQCAADRLLLLGPSLKDPKSLPEFRQLSPEGREAVESILSGFCPSSYKEWALDAKYADEVLTKLDKIVERASSLEPHQVNPESIAKRNLKAYFEEAHRCYLYGFHRACAVLCRAMLESGLRGKDPDHEGKPLEDLIQRSELKHALRYGADEVRKAGNLAAHDAAKFEENDAPRL